MRVAVLDSGIFPHVDLREKIIYGKNFTDEGNSQNTTDNFGHGTHIAGIIHSIVPDAQILIVKVLDRYGKGSTLDIAEGIYYAIEKNVDIINMSFNCEKCVDIENAIDDALEKGITIVAASGNNNIIEYPASREDVLSVGSLSSEDNISKFSSDKCDAYEVGEDIYSTYINDSYEYMTGTSMATAKITGYIVKELIDSSVGRSFA